MAGAVAAVVYASSTVQMLLVPIRKKCDCGKLVPI